MKKILNHRRIGWIMIILGEMPTLLIAMLIFGMSWKFGVISLLSY